MNVPTSPTTGDGSLGPPIDVVDLLGPERAALLDMLDALDPGAWTFAPDAPAPSAVVELPVDAFWRRAVRMIDRTHVVEVARVEGDATLVDAVIDLRGAIVAA